MRREIDASMFKSHIDPASCAATLDRVDPLMGLRHVQVDRESRIGNERRTIMCIDRAASPTRYAALAPELGRA